jgi:ubiquinone/menaquinone biosynthesis C-methylase UbiE
VHRAIQTHVHSLINESNVTVQRALEVGGHMGRRSLLRLKALAEAERFCLNIAESQSKNGIVAVTGNANQMDMFDDGEFDLVVTNAVLEHDKHFWLTLEAMRRVLRPGGLLIIGVPGFTRGGPPPHRRSTLTFEVHFAYDYYRFSEQAVEEVFFGDFEGVEVSSLLVPPRLVGSGNKPR